MLKSKLVEFIIYDTIHGYLLVNNGEVFHLYKKDEHQTIIYKPLMPLLNHIKVMEIIQKRVLSEKEIGQYNYHNV